MEVGAASPRPGLHKARALDPEIGIAWDFLIHKALRALQGCTLYRRPHEGPVSGLVRHQRCATDGDPDILFMTAAGPCVHTELASHPA